MANSFSKSVRCMSKRDLHAVVLGNVDKALKDIGISDTEPAEVIVQLADYPTGTRLDISILPAKGARGTVSHSQKESPSVTENSDTNSAKTAPPLFDLILPVGDPTSAQVKCSKCDAVATALVWKLVPSGIEEEIDPLKALELSKRIVFCTGCANMSLKN